VSVGNVGQLAVDLLINTWRLPRVGYMDHPALLPLVGNNAFDHTQPAGHLHTVAEGWSRWKGGVGMIRGLLEVRGNLMFFLGLGVINNEQSMPCFLSGGSKLCYWPLVVEQGTINVALLIPPCLNKTIGELIF